MGETSNLIRGGSKCHIFFHFQLVKVVNIWLMSFALLLWWVGQCPSKQSGCGTQSKCFYSKSKVFRHSGRITGHRRPIVIRQLAREGAEWHQFLEHPSRWDCSQCREILRYYHLSYYIQHIDSCIDCNSSWD